MLVSRRRPLRYILLSITAILIWYFLSPAQNRAGLLSQFGAKSRPQYVRLAPDTSAGKISPTPASKKVETFAKTPAEHSSASESSEEADAPEPFRSSESEESRSSTFLLSNKGQQKPLGQKPAEEGTVLDPDKNIDKEEHGSEKNGSYIQIGARKFYPRHPPKLIQEMHGLPLELPKLQHVFDEEPADEKTTRLKRQAAVKRAFQHAWQGYREHAWMADELMPVNALPHTTFGGWGATLVDTLDTLWIMGLDDEFDEAVNATRAIDFSSTPSGTLSLFETTIRYLGGFLGAYDISDGKYPVLLEKAKQVADLLYCAFDTENHMPTVRLALEKALEGEDQVPGSRTTLAEIGSLSLEFTRLSQLTGDMKYYDAITRVMEELQKGQSQSRIPGLWPTYVNAQKLTFTDTSFTLNGLADSMYEYLPKQHIMLGGKSEIVRYDKMYKFAVTGVMNHIVFQPMLPDEEDILFIGTASATNIQGNPPQSKITAQAQHLGCFAGGMVGLGAKLFDQPEHMNMARKLVDGCIWAYQYMPTCIMPECFDLVPCDMNSDCKWNQTLWEEKLREKVDRYRFHTYPAEGENSTEPAEPELTPIDKVMEDNRLKPGILSILDRRYILRPEAIESVFVHYRLTGDKDLPDKAWKMFTAIENATRTDIAHAAIMDVMTDTEKGEKIEHQDSMESFWLAETLKYFYLMFSEPDIVDLDTFVLNTEAHPFRRPVPGEPFVNWKDSSLSSIGEVRN